MALLNSLSLYVRSSSLDSLRSSPSLRHDSFLTPLFRQGSLKDWTFKDRLSALTLPVLIVSGRHDEAAPFIQEILKAGLPQAEQRIFEHSAHCPHAEERDAYNEVVGNFLKKHDV